MSNEAHVGGKADAPEMSATSNLFALAATVTTMQRLLGRRETDGGLVPAEAQMIGLAVDRARVEVHEVAALLAGLPENPAGTQRDGIATLLKATDDLEVILDALADAVGRMTK
ncbi:hypothetical protein [Methylobacterium sp. SD21]|uniref:hypothetical protein n=1 Tax=Methylobacterium litchii TaxID=3138810 RepID=UPI00313B7B0D